MPGVQRSEPRGAGGGICLGPSRHARALAEEPKFPRAPGSVVERCFKPCPPESHWRENHQHKAGCCSSERCLQTPFQVRLPEPERPQILGTWTRSDPMPARIFKDSFRLVDIKWAPSKEVPDGPHKSLV